MTGFAKLILKVNRDGELVIGQEVRDGAVVRALASYQCVPGSIPGPGGVCGLSLLLILLLASRGFSPGIPVFPSPQKPTFPNSNSIWNCQALYHEPLAQVIAQALPVFDIKFAFTFFFYMSPEKRLFAPALFESIVFILFPMGNGREITNYLQVDRKEPQIHYG